MRVRARVRGVVQGVGYRPFVYGLASSFGLSGFVLNDASGVLVEVEGARVEEFVARLRCEAPPLARVESVSCEVVEEVGFGGVFEIRASPRNGRPDAPISPDMATCAACLRELFDPSDRRFRYPFINCTDCGPRFTIVVGVPYDRPWTTMAGFAMCAACQAEYDDPHDRRFHAQPNACPDCGPRVKLVPSPHAEAPASRTAATAPAAAHPPSAAAAAPSAAAAAPPAAASRSAAAPAPPPPSAALPPVATASPTAAPDAIAAAAEALRSGAIVAVKGVGGFHLACRADDEAAVGRLRARKHREDRPFAVMARDLDAAAALIGGGEDFRSRSAEILSTPLAPIVIAPRRPGANVAPSVAPRSNELGVMLPYSPLHHLLLADAGVPLVMTSGNVSDEPIAYEDDDARERLATIADLFLLHDRPIHTRVDDSVVRGGRIVRRSRGFVPSTLAVAPAPPLLAVGAELKHTFALARDGRAWVSHHIGDLRNYETLRSFTRGVAHFERLFAVTPELVAHDLHPEYLSTKFALDLGLPAVGVQHHHAHLAAALAEHGVERAAGAIYDGTGYGTDGTVWGGELLRGDLAGFERLGHLWPVRMPGGEAAIREPWRMACAWLLELGDTRPRFDPARWEQVAALARSGLASPVTTSMGRLFDAVAALCGLRHEVTYEGQAAIELEAIADPRETTAYPLDLGHATASGHASASPVAVASPPAATPPAAASRPTAPLVLDARVTVAAAAPPNAATRPAAATPPAAASRPTAPLVLDARVTVAAVVRDLEAGVPLPLISARFHNAVAAATAAALQDEPTVVLSGGVFQNELLLARTLERLPRALVPTKLPVNDGGIAYGQAAVAAAS